MSRPPELRFDFPAHFDVEVLERIPRDFNRSRVFSFPDAVRVDPQREVPGGTILAIRPATGEEWIGLFESRRYGTPPAASRRVFGWPDQHSLCVVQGGTACLILADKPSENVEIDCFPVTDVLVIPDRDLVVFADFVSLIAYGPAGVAWRSSRLAWDDMQIVSADGAVLIVSGFDPTGRLGSSHPTFMVDLDSGQSADKPYDLDS